MAIEALVRIERAERFAIEKESVVFDTARLPSTVVIVNLSRTGCLFRGGGSFSVGDPISIGIPGAGSCPARISRIATDGCGCAFDTPLGPERLAQALAADHSSEILASERIRMLRQAATAVSAADRPRRPFARLHASMKALLRPGTAG